MEPESQPSSAGQDPKSGAVKPVRYIRTFAGDIKVVQENNIPDLVPLKEISAPPPPVQREPLVEPAPATPPQPREPIANPPQTYAGDFSDRLRATSASTATVLAAEQDSGRRVAAPEAVESPRNNLLYIIGGAALLIVGGAGALYAYFHYSAALAPVVLAPTALAPIFVDDREELGGTGAALTQAITRSVARPLAPHSIRLLSTSTTTNTGIFSLLDVSAPSVLLRNINAASSMAGVVNAGGEQSPFFILSVSTYGATLAGMLSWETSMPRALAALFSPRLASPAPVEMASTTATITVPAPKGSTPKKVTVNASSTPPVPVFIPGFRDEVVANHDVRIYRDAAGKSVLLYGYWNQTTLVIARSPQAFNDILGRLATSRTAP